MPVYSTRNGKELLPDFSPKRIRGQDNQVKCIHSAALRFIPYAEMDEEGYGDYRDLLEDRGVNG